MSSQQYIDIVQQAKFSTIGKLNANTKQVWIVLHGYGQLSQYFIRKFSILSENGHFVIAPEALSKFYLSENSQRVGATWMTKEDRLNDIENYIRYLNTLYDSFDFSDNQNVTVLGFSQGAATASRWLAHGHVHADRLLLWSGIFPPDMDIINARDSLINTEVYNIYGSEDPYLNEEKRDEQRKIIEQLQLPTKHITFKGVHDIDTKTLSLFK